MKNAKSFEEYDLFIYRRGSGRYGAFSGDNGTTTLIRNIKMVEFSNSFYNADLVISVPGVTFYGAYRDEITPATAESLVQAMLDGCKGITQELIDKYK